MYNSKYIDFFELFTRHLHFFFKMIGGKIFSVHPKCLKIVLIVLFQKTEVHTV